MLSQLSSQGHSLKACSKSHLCKNADGARDSKEHSVKVGLSDPVVLKKHPTVSIYIRPRVLDL